MASVIYQYQNTDFTSALQFFYVMTQVKSLIRLAENVEHETCRRRKILAHGIQNRNIFFRLIYYYTGNVRIIYVKLSTDTSQCKTQEDHNNGSHHADDWQL